MCFHQFNFPCICHVKMWGSYVNGNCCTSAGETHLRSESKMWKFLSYNVWFREDLEMHKRMKAVGNLIELHSPDVICFQVVSIIFLILDSR